MRQAGSVVRLEIKKSFLARRALWIYLLAGLPLVLTAGHSLIEAARTHPGCSIPEDSMVYAGIFQFFYLRLGIFFGCVGIFSNLFRAEMLEKTMHYYLLTPVRREVLLVGKYLAGLTTAALLFTASVVLSFLTVSAHFGQQYRDFILNGPGGWQLTWYATVTVLACVGYGAVFLVTGLLYRNPMIPAAVIMVWEAINGFLPALLQKFSITFYLKSLSPVEVPVKGPLALIAVNVEPTPAWIAIPGLLLVSAVILFLAARRASRLEISYTE
jgi:ABC-type transport system involved in multi-copper enzyme maturation permease subunit